ncbi:MAG: 2OG-Fe(II) oxygenase [Pedobacter sp.]|nr:MAG: 2OG-Fe(II) oxygenase [Pedobacter sp.]
MQKIFDTLIDSFIVNKVGIAQNFLTEKLCLELKHNLETLYNNKLMLSAGIGNNTIVDHDKLIRNDKIYWLDRAHENQYENDFFEVMDRFVSHLNNSCYTGITGYEFHYALYEKGSFYKKHLDQFKNNQSRKYSMIIYLNKDWQQDDGGELCIHHNPYSENIAPTSGKGIFFDSSLLEHEVLTTNKPRMSITGWLKIT